MSNENSGNVGDIVLDKNNQLSMIVQKNVLAANRLDVIDVGISLRPSPGVQLAIAEPYRVVIPMEQILKMAEQHHSIDFSSRPEEPLTEVQKLKRENEKIRREFEQRLAALEQKSQ
jgi:hypothetical protein